MKGFNLFKPKSRIIVNKDDYHNGVARVQCKDGHYNYVDTKEHFLFKSGFYKAEEFTGPCAIADDQLLKYDGQVLFNGSVSHLKGMESYFVVYKNSYQDQKCALVSPEGERLTEYEYSRIYVGRNGAIIASYTKKKYSPLSLSAIDGESLWWCELDSNGKELTPRMSYDREWVNDSLCTCRIYNWNRFDPCSCLYNTKEKVIVRKSVRYIEETKQYRFSEVTSSDDSYDSEERGTARKYGILNLDLKEVLPAQFDEFSQQLALTLAFHEFSTMITRMGLSNKLFITSSRQMIITAYMTLGGTVFLNRCTVIFSLQTTLFS